MFIASGQIGEAWATVILEEIAKENIDACTTVFDLQEILEASFHAGSHYIGKKLYRNTKRIIGQVYPITVRDFDVSYQLFMKYPDKSPRELLRVAFMNNNKIDDIFTIDGPDYHGIEKVNVITLDKLFESLKLKGSYIDERSQSSKSIIR
jgi:hypothetical protein